MGKNIKVDFKDLQEFQKSVEEFQETYDAFAEKLAKEIAARLLRRVTQRTPVGDYSGKAYACTGEGKRPHKGSYIEGKSGGTLKKGWKAAKNSIEIRKMVGMYEVEVINPTMYADYVESGHRTRGGGGWVPGHFFLQISEEEIQALAPALVEKADPAETKGDDEVIQGIIDGMSIAISAEFGEDYTIYTEDIEQGLETPCFYLSCVDAQQNGHRGDVYFAEHRFMVLYFPKPGEPKTECLRTADRLWNALEIIDTPAGKRMGTKMQAEIKDNLLNFSLTYSVYLRRASEEADYMEELTGTYKEYNAMEKTEKAETKRTESQYFKGQILQSKKYAHRKDILGALLKDGERYTLSQVDALLNRFMKGKVK